MGNSQAGWKLSAQGAATIREQRGCVQRRVVGLRPLQWRLAALLCLLSACTHCSAARQNVTPPKVSRQDLAALTRGLDESQQFDLARVHKAISNIGRTTKDLEAFYSLGSETPLWDDPLNNYVRSTHLWHLSGALIDHAVKAAGRGDIARCRQAVVLAIDVMALFTDAGKSPPAKLPIGPPERKQYMPGSAWHFQALVPVTVGLDQLSTGLKAISKSSPGNAASIQAAIAKVATIQAIQCRYTRKASQGVYNRVPAKHAKVIAEELRALNRELLALRAQLQRDITTPKQ